MCSVTRLKQEVKRYLFLFWATKSDSMLLLLKQAFLHLTFQSLWVYCNFSSYAVLDIINAEMHRRGKYIVNKDEHCLTCCFCSQDSDIKDYQMWVRYGKEDSPYPLIGKFVFTLIIRDFFFLSQLVPCWVLQQNQQVNTLECIS
jgi:hypothetical protein